MAPEAAGMHSFHSQASSALSRNQTAEEFAIESQQDMWPQHAHAIIKPVLHACRKVFIYALIEGVLDESCYPMLKLAADLGFIALYDGMANADDETLGLSPLLVEYADAGASTWMALLEKMQGKPALSIIITPESLDALAIRLRPWCVVDAAESPLALSFADTRVLPELFTVLTTAQIGQLCGSAVHWGYAARDGNWTTLKLPAQAQALRPATAVTFDEKQCAKLIDAAEADTVLAQMRTYDAALVERHGPAQAHALIRHWLRCADEAGLERFEERIDLCGHGLRCADIDGNTGLDPLRES